MGSSFLSLPGWTLVAGTTFVRSLWSLRCDERSSCAPCGESWSTPTSNYEWVWQAVGTCSNQELGKPSWYYWITSMQVGFFSQQGHYPRGLRPALSSGNAVCISSTAQGGGGSFKDRKPIGEVSCCDAWMAERIHWLIERKVAEALSLSNYLSVAYLSLPFPSIYLLSIHLSIHSSIYFFNYLSIYPSIYLCIYLSSPNESDLIWSDLFFSYLIFPSIHPFIHLSI